MAARKKAKKKTARKKVNKKKTAKKRATRKTTKSANIRAHASRRLDFGCGRKSAVKCVPSRTAIMAPTSTIQMKQKRASSSVQM